MNVLQRVFYSILGSQLLTQALLFYIPVFVYRTTGKASDLGIVFFLEWLPAIAIFPFAGKWIRRYSPIMVLRVVVSIRAILLLCIAAGGFLGALPTPIMYAALFIFSITMSFYRLSTEVLVVRQFSKEEAAAAQSKIQTTDILAFVLGPFFGGLFVDWLSLGQMFGIGALAMVLLHALIDRLHFSLPQAQTRDNTGADFGFRAALHFIFTQPMLRAHVLLNFSINMVTGFVLAMSVPLVVEVFAHPESHAAFANAAGAIASSILVSRLAGNKYFQDYAPLCGLVFFVIILLAAAQAATAGSFALYAASIVIFQASIQGHNLYHRLERLKHIPPERFSQVLGSLYLSFLLPLPLCGLVVRLLNNTVPYSHIILWAVMAASMIGAVCYASIFFLRQREDVNAS